MGDQKKVITLVFGKEILFVCFIQWNKNYKTWVKGLF